MGLYLQFRDEPHLVRRTESRVRYHDVRDRSQSNRYPSRSATHKQYIPLVVSSDLYGLDVHVSGKFINSIGVNVTLHQRARNATETVRLGVLQGIQECHSKDAAELAVHFALAGDLAEGSTDPTNSLTRPLLACGLMRGTPAC